MLITAVEPQAKNKDRVNIYADGEFLCGMELIVSIASGIKTGKEISKAEMDEAIRKSESEEAFKKAAKYIGIRMRSVHELREYLKEKGYPDFITEETIEKMKKYGYAGDEEFVKHYVSIYGSKRGIIRIRQDLFRLGVNESLLDKYVSGMDQLSGAVKDLEKYLKTRPFDRQKCYSHLMSKGYESDIIMQAIGSLDK